MGDGIDDNDVHIGLFADIDGLSISLWSERWKQVQDIEIPQIGI